MSVQSSTMQNIQSMMPTFMKGYTTKNTLAGTVGAVAGAAISAAYPTSVGSAYIGDFAAKVVVPFAAAGVASFATLYILAKADIKAAEAKAKADADAAEAKAKTDAQIEGDRKASMDLHVSLNGDVAPSDQPQTTELAKNVEVAQEPKKSTILGRIGSILSAPFKGIYAAGAYILSAIASPFKALYNAIFKTNKPADNADKATTEATVATAAPAAPEVAKEEPAKA